MNNTDSLVSIIMPAYNAEKYITKAIESILSQTHTNIELLVADDGSIDNTKNIIDSFTDKRIKKSHNKENIGNLKTCNNLIDHATGDYITLQDADDWSDENRISMLLKEFENDSELKMVSSDIFRVDESGNILKLISYPRSYMELKSQLPDKFPFVCSSVMIKAEVFKEFGGLNPYFDRAGSADYYWMGKILLYNKAITCNAPLYYYRVNNNSFTKSINKNIRVLYSTEIVTYLLQQQIQFGTDDIESGNLKKLRKIEERLKIKYLLWQDKYKQAFYKALKLIVNNPVQPVLFYKNLIVYFKKAIKLKLNSYLIYIK